MDLCRQIDVSAFKYTVYVHHSFSSKEHVSFKFMTAITIFSDFETQENKVCHCFNFFLIYLPWSDGTRCHDLSFWMLSVKSAFSLASFTFTKRLFHSSSLSAIRVVSSVYLRLLVFLPPWRRERLPTSVFWPGEFHGLSPRGHKELDMTERPSLHFTFFI